MKRIKQTFVKSLKVLVVLSAVLLFSQCEKDDDGTNDTNNNGIVFGSLTDSRDGETYKTVKIGDQVWMAENLRTKKFNDGTEIPLVTDNSEWEALQTPAYCWYDNDEATNKATYGALYNWYTVETEKLCPVGWHIPSEDEWITLLEYVGGEIGAGTVLKSTTGWNNDGNGTDEYGFGAMPGGARFYLGTYQEMGKYGSWWTSRDSYTGDATYVSSGYSSDNFYRLMRDFRWGLSVRCVKD